LTVIDKLDSDSHIACARVGVAESAGVHDEQTDRAPGTVPARPTVEVLRKEELASPAKPRRRRRSFVLLALAATALVIGGLYLYLPGFYEVETDDAYVDAHVISIVPKVAAYVSALHVDDNSKVEASELLVELDPRDFQVAVDAATADKANAGAVAANIDAQLREQQSLIAQNEAAIDGDRATLEFAQQELQRYSVLANTGSGTTQRWQQAQADSGQRRATLQRDQAAVNAARAHVAVLETQAHQARATIDRQQASLAQAQLNLSYTKIYAVDAGTVANKRVEVGNYVQPGQVLFSIVPNTLYVTANYKETQLTGVRPGRPATVWVDAFPNLRLQAHVDSIQRGTGSQFALLPPENATGNFVKVVQRVPVKIVFDDPGEALRWFAPGMSVETRIVVSPSPWWLKWFVG
jgi:membrane fusion protein, multidrug efflux system